MKYIKKQNLKFISQTHIISQLFSRGNCKKMDRMDKGGEEKTEKHVGEAGKEMEKTFRQMGLSCPQSKIRGYVDACMEVC